MKTLIVLAAIGAAAYFMLKKRTSSDSRPGVATVDYGAQGASDAGLVQSQVAPPSAFPAMPTLLLRPMV